VQVPAGLLTVRPVWCRIEEREKVSMFDEENYYDYESILEDTDPLYEDEDYSDDEYDYSNEREFDCYYHNIIDELDY
jgi:hypothetical protein